VYGPNSAGRPFSDLTGPVEDSRESDGPMVRSAYELHAEDDDFGQAGTLVRDMWNDAQRAEFVDTVAGHLLGGVKGEVLLKAFEYWKSVDGDTGKQIEEKVRGAGGA
jgi:catalase